MLAAQSDGVSAFGTLLINFQWEGDWLEWDRLHSEDYAHLIKTTLISLSFSAKSWQFPFLVDE